MLTLKHIGAAAIASLIATAIVVDTADARRGGGGGGGARAGGGIGGGGAMRAGGLGGGGAVRGASFNRGGAIAGNRMANAGSLARVSNPIAGRPDIGRPGRPDIGRPGRPDWGNRPGWGGGGWGGDNWPGYGWGWGAAAVGAGLAYGASTNYCDPNYDPYCSNYGYGSYGSYAPAYAATYGNPSDAIADCARRFRSYDPASQTYLSYGGQRVSCP
jgi:BA14K-like protein